MKRVVLWLTVWLVVLADRQQPKYDTNKDYYNVLGVPQSADTALIRRAYKKLAKQYHPDVNPSGKDRFLEIQEASEVLTGDDRAAYDDERAQIRSGRRRPQSNFGYPSGGSNVYMHRYRGPDGNIYAYYTQGGPNYGQQNSSERTILEVVVMLLLELFSSPAGLIMAILAIGMGVTLVEHYGKGGPNENVPATQPQTEEEPQQEAAGQQKCVDPFISMMSKQLPQWHPFVEPQVRQIIASCDENVRILIVSLPRADDHIRHTCSCSEEALGCAFQRSIRAAKGWVTGMDVGIRTKILCFWVRNPEDCIELDATRSPMFTAALVRRLKRLVKRNEPDEDGNEAINTCVVAYAANPRFMHTAGGRTQVSHGTCCIGI
jgi:hypothetical protein